MKIRALADPTVPEITYYWRIDLPFKYLRPYGISAEKIYDFSELEEDTDILILPKMYVRHNKREETMKIFEKCSKRGIRLVYDADDDMWSEGFTQYMVHMQWKKSDEAEMLVALIEELERRRNGNIWTIMQCDAITVSTKELGDYVRTITGKPVFVVENAIPVKEIDEKLNKDLEVRHPHYTTIGWAGGARPLKDLEPMLTAWNTLAIDDGIKFVISGWQPDLSQYPNLVDDKLIRLEWTSVDEYMNNMQVDIGCCCVGDYDFSRRKSVLKAMEFSLAGALVVGSKTLYGNEPIVSCETVEDWVKVLNFYVYHSVERELLAESYNKHIRGRYDMNFNWVYWADAYQKIINTVKPMSDERTTVSV